MNINGIHRGTVIATDTAEDTHLGRIKVEVHPFLISENTANSLENHDDYLPIEAFPWAIPAPSISNGAGSGYGNFAVPEIGSNVWVFFEKGDVYQPVYFAEAPDGIKGQFSELDSDYPFKKIFKSKTGLIISLNTKSGSEQIKITHPTGTIISIDSDGSLNISTVEDINIDTETALTISAVADVTINTEKALTVVAADDITVNTEKDLNLTAAGNITLTATEIHFDKGS